MESIISFIFFLAIGILIWLVIRGIVLWYFKLDRIVELLEQIETNTRTVIKEDVYFSQNGIVVTSGRVVVPPKSWMISELQPVRVEPSKGKFLVRLLDRDGRQLHEVNADAEEKVRLFAAAINRAKGIGEVRNETTHEAQFN